MGYYDTEKLLLDDEAKNYTLCDNMFHSVFGGHFSITSGSLLLRHWSGLMRQKPINQFDDDVN
jgi:hypothetical protein